MMQHEQVQYLLSQLLDGDPSDSELAELNQLLRSDVVGRDLLIDYLLMDSLLSENVGAEPLTALVDLVADQASISTQGNSTAVRTAILPSSFWKPLSWVAAAAVFIIAAFLVGRWDNTASASPTRVVRAALIAHHQPVERVYMVEVQSKPSIQGNPFGIDLMRDVHVHTQGDRFYVEMNRDTRRWVWGRNLEGAFWLTLGPHRAMQIEADEAGIPLQFIGDLYELELESLLDSFLKFCRLTYSHESESLHVITATPVRRWQRRIQSATIEVDRETKAVRRLVLNQLLPERGECTVTFTLVDSGIPDESKYSVEGHLEKPFTLYNRKSQPEQRRKVLSNWNGLASEKWIK